MSLLFCFVTEDLEALKKQAFVLKEGVEYKIKISFKVSINSKKWSWSIITLWPFCIEFATPHSVFNIMAPFEMSWFKMQLLRPSPLCTPQVNKEIVSGLKYVQQTYRKGLRSECF